MSDSAGSPAPSPTPPSPDHHQAAASSSPFTPFRHRWFRALWIAGLMVYLGLWMQNVGAAWLMTTLTASPLIVALITTASSLPLFLLALPGGVLADQFDRRKLLLVTHAVMLFTATLLSVMTYMEAIGPFSLLFLTFVLGTALALQSPAWLSITPDLVSRAEVPAAAALNGISYNIARAVGPAIAGGIIALFGPAAVFPACTVCFLAVLLVVWRWRGTPQIKGNLPAERMIGAMRSGLRYVRHSPVIVAQLVRSVFFVSCASGLMALLPLIAREQFGANVGAGGYGLLLGCMGGGAVLGALMLPRIRARLGYDSTVVAASLLYASATLMVAFVGSTLLMCLALVSGGVAWTVSGSSLGAAIQSALPAWVRARGLAMLLLTFQGAMSIGSLLWGSVASVAGVQIALVAAAAVLFISVGFAHRFPIRLGEESEVTPSHHWSEPRVVGDLSLEDGPVSVSIEYRIRPETRAEFMRAIHAVGVTRRRDGAFFWRLYRDITNPNRYLERFIVDSWGEHLRQRERATVADRMAEERLRAFLETDAPPPITYLMAERYSEAET